MRRIAAFMIVCLLLTGLLTACRSRNESNTTVTTVPSITTMPDMGEMLHSQSDMSFKESMKLCRTNYVTLRVARKLIAGQNAAEAAGEAEYTIAFDKEEFSCFRKLAAE